MEEQREGALQAVLVDRPRLGGYLECRSACCGMSSVAVLVHPSPWQLARQTALVMNPGRVVSWCGLSCGYDSGSIRSRGLSLAGALERGRVGVAAAVAVCIIAGWREEGGELVERRVDTWASESVVCVCCFVCAGQGQARQDSRPDRMGSGGKAGTERKAEVMESDVRARQTCNLPCVCSFITTLY